MEYKRTKDWYVRKRLPNHKLGYQHIWKWEQKNGPVRKGYVIDHINGDRDDNRLCNLREIPFRENIWLNYNYYLNKKTKRSIALGRLKGPGKRVNARKGLTNFEKSL